tara:strand:- start:1169 stop:1384 length:216 start_codon:yes stop_codon:yes gene_type:complete
VAFGESGNNNTLKQKNAAKNMAIANINNSAIVSNTLITIAVNKKYWGSWTRTNNGRGNNPVHLPVALHPNL